MVVVTTFCPTHDITPPTQPLATNSDYNNDDVPLVNATSVHPHSDYNNDDTTAPSANSPPPHSVYNNADTTHNTPGTTTLGTIGYVTPTAPSNYSDYQLTPHPPNAQHSTALPPHAAEQGDMALLGLVPLSVFMP